MWLSMMISELERERAMRVYVFPRLIKDGKLTSTEAQARAARFDAAIELLKTLVDHGVATSADLPLRLVAPPILTTGKVSDIPFPIIKGCA